MSGDSTQGVLAASAKANVVVAAVATASKRVQVVNRFILKLPNSHRSQCLQRSTLFEQITNVVEQSIRRSDSSACNGSTVWDLPWPTCRLCSRRTDRCEFTGDDSDEPGRDNVFGRRAFRRDAGSCCPGRRIQALQQPEDFLQPRPEPRQAQYRNLQVLRIPVQRQD